MATGLAKLAGLASTGNITKKDALDLGRAVTGLRAKADTLKSRVEEKVDNVVGALESTASGAVMAGIDGYFGQSGPVTVVGIPVSVAAGLAAHFGALVMDGEVSKHLAHLGNGALTWAAGRKTYEWSLKFRERRGPARTRPTPALMLGEGSDVEGETFDAGTERTLVEGDNAPEGAMLSADELEKTAAGH